MLEKLEHILYLGAILGVAPFGMKHPVQRARQFIFICVLFVFNMLLVAYGFQYHLVNQYSIITNFVTGFVFFFQVSASLLMFGEIVFYYEAHFTFMRELFSTEQYFRQKLQMFLQAWHAQGIVSRKYKLSVYVFLCHTIAVVLALIRFEIQSYFYFVVPSLILLHGRGLILIIYVDIMTEYLRMLNAKLKAILNATPTALLMDINIKQLNSLSFLLKLKGAYGQIFKLCENFNSAYGWSLFLFVMILTFDVITMFYWIVLTLETVYRTSYLCYNGTTFLVRLYMLLLLCRSCDSCKCQWQLTGRLVQRLISSQHQSLNRCNYNEVLSDFSMQLTDCPIIINGYGFFALDLSSLFSVNMFCVHSTHLYN